MAIATGADCAYISDAQGREIVFRMIGQRQCLELLASDSSTLREAEMENEKPASAAASLHLVTIHAGRAQRS